MVINFTTIILPEKIRGIFKGGFHGTHGTPLNPPLLPLFFGVDENSSDDVPLLTTHILNQI